MVKCRDCRSEVAGANAVVATRTGPYPGDVTRHVDITWRCKGCEAQRLAEIGRIVEAARLRQQEGQRAEEVAQRERQAAQRERHAAQEAQRRLQQVEAQRAQQEREAQRQLRQQQEEASRLRAQLEQATRQLQQQQEAERLRAQREEAERRLVEAPQLPVAGAPVGLQIVRFEDLAAASENFSPARRLGQGAFGSVFHAQWQGMEVAIKRQGESADEQEMESISQAFHREVDTALACRHPHLIPIVAVTVTQPLCIVYPLMTNGALDTLLESRPGELTAAIRVRLALDLCCGLAFLHSTQTNKPPHIHRDVKSANVLVDGTLRARLADFGLAKRTDVRRSTLAGVVGTTTHQAPEIHRMRPHTAASDVFSMGVVFLELLTGLPPFDDSFDEPLLYHRLGDELPHNAVRLAARQANFTNDVAQEFGRIISECIAERPAQRPSAAVVEQALHEILARMEQPPPPPPDAGSRECLVCFSSPRQALLQPCNHFVACRDCVQAIRARGSRQQPARCPLCREPIGNVQYGGSWTVTNPPRR